MVEPRKGPKGQARRKIKPKKNAAESQPQEPVVLEPDEEEEDERLPGYVLLKQTAKGQLLGGFSTDQ